MRHTGPNRWRQLLLWLLLWLPFAAQAAQPATPYQTYDSYNNDSSDDSLDLSTPYPHALGDRLQLLIEGEQPLSPQQAMRALLQGQFAPSDQRYLNFGIDARPVWLALRLHNDSRYPLHRQLSLDTSWLDKIDVYYFDELGLQRASDHGGDRQPYHQRPISNRYFLFDHYYPPGTTQVLIRVESIDPMVLPLYLRSLNQSAEHKTLEAYGYGFLYGIILALLIYNLMLSARLQSLRYLFYSAYLLAFVLMNFSYTGHAYQWLWPNFSAWQQLANPLLMLIFALSGLLFGASFIDARRHFPWLFKLLMLIIGSFSLTMLGAVVAGSQAIALQIAFVAVVVFSAGMITLGTLSTLSGLRIAKYFLFATLIGATTTAVTGLTVWNLIPYHPAAYQAIEIGMMAEAILLALALADQFRQNLEDKNRAEQIARLDPLTGIYNRRAFYELAAPIWNQAIRHQQQTAVVMVDIDHFKQLNDQHGHAAGDDALRQVAHCLNANSRGADIVARWGGEEFILLLPQTPPSDAFAIANRHRRELSRLKLEVDGQPLQLTASFGVGLRSDQTELDALINHADGLLYKAKEKGRDRVCSVRNC